MPVTGIVPNPGDEADEGKRAQLQRMLDYMALTPGQSDAPTWPIDVVFIGSCTNGRIEDIRAAAAVAKGRHVAPGVQALVVPGSGLVKRQAEQEGLDRVLLEAGFEWRDPCCSMCLGMNPDKLTPGQRCASTSNRNFEGRQEPERPHASAVPRHGRRRRGDGPADGRSAVDVSGARFTAGGFAFGVAGSAVRAGGGRFLSVMVAVARPPTACGASWVRAGALWSKGVGGRPSPTMTRTNRLRNQN